MKAKIIFAHLFLLSASLRFCFALFKRLASLFTYFAELFCLVRDKIQAKYLEIHERKKLLGFNRYQSHMQEQDEYWLFDQMVRKNTLVQYQVKDLDIDEENKKKIKTLRIVK